MYVFGVFYYSPPPPFLLLLAQLARAPVWLHARTGRFLLVLAAILWTSLVGDGAARSGLQLDMLRSVVDVHRRIASTR